MADGHIAQEESVQRDWLPERIAGALLRTPDLSPREAAVFELLGMGYDNRSLARVLRISERTAKRHVTGILAKLGLESRLQAGLAALLALLWPEGRMDLQVAGGETNCDRDRAQRWQRLMFPWSLVEEGSMSFDALDALREAGNPVDLLSVAQQEVFAQLRPEEVAVLNFIKKRLDELPDAEVEGQGEIKVL